MSGVTIRCSFRSTRRSSARRSKAPQASGKTVKKVAQMLALAHHIEQLIEAGQLTCNADASRTLGLTRARMTQVMNLMLLSPVIQERVLTGELKATERALRPMVATAEWSDQALPILNKQNR